MCLDGHFETVFKNLLGCYKRDQITCNELVGFIETKKVTGDEELINLLSFMNGNELERFDISRKVNIMLDIKKVFLEMQKLEVNIFKNIKLI
jgi:hypothetical protein